MNCELKSRYDYSYILTIYDSAGSGQSTEVRSSNCL